MRTGRPILNTRGAGRFFLAALLALAGAFVSCPALAGEAQPEPEPPHLAPWFDQAWQWRQIVTLAEGVGLERFETGAATLEVADPESGGGLARPDYGDIRVTTLGGRVLPHALLEAGAGQVTVRFPLVKDGPQTYCVYYGNPDAPPPLGNSLPASQGGVRLEMRAYESGRIEDLATFRELFEAAKANVIGNGLRTEINDNGNPFAEGAPRCLAVYDAVLRAPAGGYYGLRFKASGFASFLLDGQPLLEQRRALGNFTADNSVYLEPGHHQIQLCVFSRHPTNYYAQLQWQPPDAPDYAPVPPEAFPSDVALTPSARQRVKAPMNAFFRTRVLGASRLVRSDLVLCSVRFQNLSASSLGEIKTSRWDFGDGATSTAPDAEHTYQRAGTYTATLTARDTLGFEESFSRALTISAEVRDKMELAFSEQEEQEIIIGDYNSGGDAVVPVRVGLKFLAERNADLVVEQALEWRGQRVRLMSKPLSELMQAEAAAFDAPVELPGLDGPLTAAYRVTKTASSRLERELVFEATLPNLPGRFAVESTVRYGEVVLARQAMRVVLDTDPFPGLAAYDPNLVDTDGFNVVVKSTGRKRLTRESLSDARLARVPGDPPGALRVALIDNSLCPGGPGCDEATLYYGMLEKKLASAFPSRTVVVKRFATERDTLGHFPVKRLLETGAAIEEFQPQAIVVALDEEDLLARTPTETVETYLEIMVNHFAAHTRAKVVVVAPPPRPFAADSSKVFAVALGRFALAHNVDLADLYEAVNLHGGDWMSLYVDDTVKGEENVYMMYMNTAGQRLVADTILKALLRE